MDSPPSRLHFHSKRKGAERRQIVTWYIEGTGVGIELFTLLESPFGAKLPREASAVRFHMHIITNADMIQAQKFTVGLQQLHII